jgi:hypothetical protein
MSWNIRFVPKQRGSKGKEIKRLWPKLYDRLTTGAETAGYAAWMGFDLFVCFEWSFKPKRKRKREASDSPMSSKRVKVADPDRRALNGRCYRKLSPNPPEIAFGTSA